MFPSPDSSTPTSETKPRFEDAYAVLRLDREGNQAPNSKRSKKRRKIHPKTETSRLHMTLIPMIESSITLFARYKAEMLSPVPQTDDAIENPQLTIQNCTDQTSHDHQVEGGFDLLEISELLRPMNAFGTLDTPLDISSANQTFGDGDLFNRLVSNTSAEQFVLNLAGREYLVPNNSAFMMSDYFDFVANLKPLEEYHNDKFNMIVIDPPWPSLSAARAHTYSSLEPMELLELDLPKLYSKSEITVVIVWCTNNEKYHKFVIDELFQRWQLVHFTTGYWIKITNSGELVIPLSNVHRRCYEPFFIGIHRPPASDNTPAEDKPMPFVRDPSYQFLFGIPGMHSAKPCLSAFCQQLMGISPRPLELFGRLVLPNWCVWGNESLRHNQINKYFKESTTFKTSGS